MLQVIPRACHRTPSCPASAASLSPKSLTFPNLGEVQTTFFALARMARLRDLNSIAGLR